jgi:transposase
MNRSDLNQSYAAFDQSSTIVGVIDMSLKSWVMSGTVPGVKRQPLKKLSAKDMRNNNCYDFGRRWMTA